MTTVELLRAARGKIEEGWTRGAYARDADGRSIPPESPDATCWCAFGALYAFDPNPSASVDLLWLAADGRRPTTLNDEAGDAGPVLALYDRAIELAEQGKPA